MVKDLRWSLAGGGEAGTAIPRMDRLLAALDQALDPRALAGVWQQGETGADGKVTLKINILKNRPDVAGRVSGLVTQGLSPVLWGLGAPHGVFMDGAQKPDLEWGESDYGGGRRPWE